MNDTEENDSETAEEVHTTGPETVSNAPARTRPASRALVQRIPPPPAPKDGQYILLAHLDGIQKFYPCTVEVYRNALRGTWNLMVDKDFFLEFIDGVVTQVNPMAKKTLSGFLQAEPEDMIKTSSAEHLVFRREHATNTLRVEAMSQVIPVSTMEAVQNALASHPLARTGEFLLDRHEILRIIQERGYDLITVDGFPK